MNRLFYWLAHQRALLTKEGWALPFSYFLSPFSFLLFTLSLPAQTPYFQQEVDYKIVVSLDDRRHLLTGRIDMEYTNHAPDALPEIWMHLWGNAFKNRRSAFSKQKLRSGSGRFYFAPDSTLGYYKDLDFTVDGREATWEFDPKNPDIAVIRLAQPLAPGAKITIATPFSLKIPASFSRLGHVRTSYQMTQWFPKPAVYDRKGWHAMPYLDQGEFYSEFGSFDVTITLPENYVVGATGTLQTPAEWEFLQKKEAETRREIAAGKWDRKDPFPPSATTVKTLRYTAERVHDFAWFADKRFRVLRDTARLADGRTVDCWAMFTAAEGALWQKGAFYVRRAVEFYSEHVGAYPWPQATAVHSALSAGGGMEYPMITVIGNNSNGKDLDDVITHEVGHNWLYGILASNERDHPWMDEGLNSYYERRYMRRYYGDDGLDIGLPKWLVHPAEHGSASELGYLLLARDRRDGPPDSPSDTFSLLVYGLQSYMKPAMALEWLEKGVATSKFDAAMQAYYRQWQFKHPYPEDLLAALEEHISAKWFLQSMQTADQADYALQRIERDTNGFWITVRNKGDLKGPFPVTALKDGQPLRTTWFLPPHGDTTLIFFHEARADAFAVDYYREILDVNRKNNWRRVNGGWLEPLQLKLLAPVENSRRTTVGVLPWLGWNNYDKTMIGALFYNPPVPGPRFQYYLAPGFGLGSQQFAGLADLRYKFFPGGKISRLVLGLSAKTFDYDYNWTHQYYSRFYRLAPQLRAELHSGDRTFHHAVNLRTLFIGAERGQFNAEGGFVGKAWSRSVIHEIRYQGASRRLPNPYSFKLALEGQAYDTDRPAHYLRSTGEWKQKFYYKSGRGVTARFFAGGFILNTNRLRGSVSNDLARASLALNPQGFNDYRFDQVFLGRSESEGFLSRQVSQTEGGFKNAFGAPYAGRIGNSNNFIVALNLRADLPFRLPLGLPIKPYFDIGYADDATPFGPANPTANKVLWSGGFLFTLLDGTFEVYFPLIHSPALRDLYRETDNKNYGRWITWSLRFGKIEPLDLAEQLIK